MLKEKLSSVNMVNIGRKESSIFVSYYLLSKVYIIIPFCLVIYALDRLFFDSYLQANLRISPESYFWLGLFFGTPHIIASNVILLTNLDYIKFYWRSLVGVTLFIICFFAIGNALLSYYTLFALVATTTIIHVVKQQIGIGNSSARLSGLWFNLWSWAIIVSGILLYNAIYLQYVLSQEHVYVIKIALLVVAVLTVMLAIICHRSISNNMGKTFLWFNTLMMLSSLFFYQEKYYFFAVLGPRFIHDVTAFVIYCTHDYNRHSRNAKNALYRLINKVHVSSFIAVPIIAIVITYLINVYVDVAVELITMPLFNMKVNRIISFSLIGYLSLLHYYTESFTWRNPSPYKQFIRFK
jgi:hypothetical protein